MGRSPLRFLAGFKVLRRQRWFRAHLGERWEHWSWQDPPEWVTGAPIDKWLWVRDETITQNDMFRPAYGRLVEVEDYRVRPLDVLHHVPETR